MAKAKPTRKTITELTRQKAKAGKARKLIWDAVQKGLALCIEPTGRQSWKFVYRWPRNKSPAAKSVWLTRDGLGIADARLWAQDQWKLIHDGVDPRGKVMASLQDTMTFEQLHKRYLDEHASKHNRSWKKVARDVNKHLVAAFGNRPAASIARADVREAVNAIRKAGHDPMANRVLAAARAIFGWAMSEGVVEYDANPVDELKAKKGRKRKQRWLAESEIKEFWAESFNHGAAGAGLRAMLLTGQRGVDVRLYRKAHVEDGRWWNIDPEIYKTGLPHRIYLADGALEEINVDWGTKRALATREIAMQQAAEAICEKLEQKPWTPHTLRHTVISHLARLRIAEEVRKRVVGHAEGGGAHEGYNHHQYDDEKKAVMIKWEAELRRIITGSGEVKQFPKRA